MILAIGIDSVEIERFSEWTTYSHKSLTRIFTISEIEYCLSCPIKSAERFAARFAAREALFKAMQNAFPQEKIAFLRFCKLITIGKTTNKAPIVSLSPGYYWDNISIKISWTHNKTSSTAIVLLQNQ